MDLWENLNYIMNGFSIESGVESLDGLLNRGGFSSMLSLVGIMLILGMLSGQFSESHVLTVLVNKLSKKLNTPGDDPGRRMAVKPYHLCDRRPVCCSYDPGSSI